jgi:methylmalonyl-CoA mutase
LGHNRSVKEIVDAAIEEDAQGIAVSSYQGGHIEFFKYMIDLLEEGGASHIQVFGGGGGVIVPEEIKELEDYGVTRIYSPEDGARIGLQGIINDMIQMMDYSRAENDRPGSVWPGHRQQTSGGQPDHDPGTGQSQRKRTPGQVSTKS